MLLKFDKNGNLVPYTKNQITYKDLQNIFVSPFLINSSRYTIFSSFDKFINKLSTDYQISKIWVDGSFITQKINPNDIDLLIFINVDWYSSNEELILKHKLDVKENHPEVDLYFLIEYPVNHRFRSFTETDILYWTNWFSQSRPNRRGESYAKGFIEINF